MAWRIEWRDSALKELSKLSRPVQKEIAAYLRERIATEEPPTRFGKPLKGDKFGLWRYRVENYRIICEIQQERLVVLVIRVGKRDTVYG